MKIVVGRWGPDEHLERVREGVAQAGADLVGTSLLETRSQVMPLVQLAAARAPECEPAEELQPAG